MSHSTVIFTLIPILISHIVQIEADNTTLEVGIWHVSNFPYINLSFGSHNTSLRLLFDTGSTSLVVKDTSCTSCRADSTLTPNFFDSLLSESLTPLRRSDFNCPSDHLCQNACSKVFKYLDKTELRTCWVNDKVSLIPLSSLNDSSISPINEYFNFYIIKEQQGEINMDGILGVQDFGRSIKDVKEKSKLASQDFVTEKGSFGFIEYVISSYKITHRTMLLDTENNKLIFGFSPTHKPSTNETSNPNQTENGKLSIFTRLKRYNPFTKIKQFFTESKNSNNQKIVKLGKITNNKINNLTYDPRKDWFANNSKRSSKFWINPSEFYNYKILIDRVTFDNIEITNESYDSYLDTGSTNIYLPVKIFDRVVEEVLEKVPEYKLFVEKANICHTYNQVKGFINKLPPISLFSESENQVKLSIDVVVKTKFVGREEDLYCSAISKINEDMIIIGFPFFLNRKILFDYKSMNISVVGNEDEIHKVGSVFKKIANIIDFMLIMI